MRKPPMLPLGQQPTTPAIYNKSFLIFRGRSGTTKKRRISAMQRQPILSLTQLIRELAGIVGQQPVQDQAQAIFSAKKSIDSMMESLLRKQNFPIGANWTIEELTTEVIENENVNNQHYLIDLVQDLATYGATSEFFISTIRLLEQGGAWG